jgi:4-aminobutyrate aminotransferase-like enzyme
MIENSRRLGDVLATRLAAFKEKYPQVGAVSGKGLVWGFRWFAPARASPTRTQRST